MRQRVESTLNSHFENTEKITFRGMDELNILMIQNEGERRREKIKRENVAVGFNLSPKFFMGLFLK